MLAAFVKIVSGETIMKKKIGYLVFVAAVCCSMASPVYASYISRSSTELTAPVRLLISAVIGFLIALAVVCGMKRRMKIGRASCRERV